MNGSLKAIYIQPMKGILCCNIGDDMKVKGLLANSLKYIADPLSLLLRPNGSHHAVTMFEENINDMPGDEASATYKIH